MVNGMRINVPFMRLEHLDDSPTTHRIVDIMLWGTDQNQNATMLPISSRTVDAVTIAFGIRNVQRPEIACGELARVLRQWLGEWPDKVLFGTDAFDNSPTYGWAESALLGAKTARRALAMALTGMMRDGEIDRPRAEQLARMVMRDNAVAAYHLHLN